MFERDPQRIADCVDRLRLSMKMVPWAIMPITTALMSLPGTAAMPLFEITIGIWLTLLLALTGLIVGYCLSVIIITFLESLALILISADRQDMVSELGNKGRGIP